MDQHVFIFLCVSMSIVQFVSLLLLLFWLRKTNFLHRKTPQQPKVEDSRSRWTTVPTFTPSLVRNAWSKHSGRRILDHSIYQLSTRENLMSSDTSDGGAYGSVSENKMFQKPKQTANDGPLVLQIYYKFLGLQAVHCLLWVILCLTLAAAGESPIAWRNKVEAKFTYYLGTGLVLFLGSALLDGVQIFLAQDSVGRHSIDKAYFFGVSWGLFNALVCTLLATIGHNRTNPTVNVIRKYTTWIPWWDPYFVRCFFTFLFNSTILSTYYFQRYQKRKKCTVSTRNETSDGYALTKTTPPLRTSCVALGLFNVLGSLFLMIIFMLDFNDRAHDIKHPEDFGPFTALLMCSYLVIYFGYTPVLYYTLIKDSRYWSESWMGALTSICPADPQIANLDNMVVEYNAVKYEQVLGRGGFSTVYRGHLWTTFPCAIKVLHVPEMTKEIVERFLQEVRIFVMLRHPNLVQFVAACISPPELCIVMELCTPMSLADHIKEHQQKLYNQKEEQRRHKYLSNRIGIGKWNKIDRMRQKKNIAKAKEGKTFGEEYISIMSSQSRGVSKEYSRGPSKEFNRTGNLFGRGLSREFNRAGNLLGLHPKLPTGLPTGANFGSENINSFYQKRFDTRQAIDIALGLASGLQYMHSTCGILHRDLKSSNILFDSHMVPKICDFGLSREFQELNENNSFAGTIAYMSPEVLRKEKAINKTDVYSFAIIFWELLTSRLAWTKYFHKDWNHLNLQIPLPRTYAFRYIVQACVTRKERPEIDKEDQIHHVLKVILKECWADDSEVRPPFSEIIDRLEAFKRSHLFEVIVRAESERCMQSESSTT